MLFMSQADRVQCVLGEVPIQSDESRAGGRQVVADDMPGNCAALIQQ